MATTWYISTTGSDTTGSGTSAAPYATVGKAVSVAASGDTIAVQTGTYTVTAAIDIPAALANLTIQGYQTTAGDGGTPPLITTATNSVNLFTTHSTSGNQIWDNLSLSNTAGTRANGILQLTNHGIGVWWIFKKCVFDGFTTAINADNNGADFDINQIVVRACEIKNCSSVGINQAPGTMWIQGSWIHNCGTGVSQSAGGVAVNADHSIFSACSLTGLNLNAGVRLTNCVVANNSAKGLWPSTSSSYVILENCIFYGNLVNQDIYFSAAYTNLARSLAMSHNNAYGANTNWGTSSGDVVLSASPFTSSTNFALNSTAGGGAACRGAGYPGAFPGGASTGSLDIGAVQAGSSAPAAAGSVSGFVF